MRWVGEGWKVRGVGELGEVSGGVVCGSVGELWETVFGCEVGVRSNTVALGGIGWWSVASDCVWV